MTITNEGYIFLTGFGIGSIGTALIFCLVMMRANSVLEKALEGMK